MIELDKNRIEKQFVKNMQSYNNQAVMQKKIAEKLSDLIGKHSSLNFKRVFEVGCGTGFFTKEILYKTIVKKYYINDFSLLMFREVLKHIDSSIHKHFTFLQGDIEYLTFPENLDAIFSSTCIHWLTDINEFLSKVSSSLNTGGILAFSSFGPYNFKEIKQIFNIGLQYHSLDELVKKMKANDFKIIHQEEWREKQYFKNVINMLKHLKRIGVTGLSSKIWTQNILKSHITNFAEFDKNTSLTYHPIIIIAEKI